MNSIIRHIAFVLLLLFCFNIYGQEENRGTNEEKGVVTKSEKKEKFQAGEFMLDHIKDNHEWHIITVGHNHISIPLPVILYSKLSGLHVFMSSKFHHGQSAYKYFSLAGEGPNKGKIIEKIGNTEYLPLDLSITKVVLSIIFSCIVLLIIFIGVAKKYQSNPNKAPSGLQSALEPLILFVRDDIVKPTIGEKNYEKYMPYLLTLFFFIWFTNMMGLIPIFPGGANVTGNVAVTMVMAIFTFIITTVSANKHYWKDIYNAPGVPWWLKFPVPIMPFIELLGVFLKPIVLTVRLFANITAGHLIALAFVSLIFIFAEMSVGLGFGVAVFSGLFSVFMMFLELLVTLIQAYVFTLLSSIYFGLAIAEPHHEKSH